MKKPRGTITFRIPPRITLEECGEAVIGSRSDSIYQQQTATNKTANGYLTWRLLEEQFDSEFNSETKLVMPVPRYHRAGPRANQSPLKTRTMNGIGGAGKEDL